MTVHMIRIWTDPPRNDNHLRKMRDACENWVASYNETLTTQRLTVSHPPPDEDEGEVDHTRGYWRFDWSEDATTLLNDLEADLQSETSWYLIKYHPCENDGGGGDCVWDDSMDRTYGTVPTGLTDANN